VAGLFRDTPEELMAEHNSGPDDATNDTVEQIKGEAKETVGEMTGRDDLRREGHGQQEKAAAQRDATKKESETPGAQGAAEASEEREKAQQ
jgi:uncharacterized protein YjbJ (UPF0337 family)